MNNSTSNRIALVTGGNKGLGLEIARQLGRAGLTVLIGARDQARGCDAEKTLKSEGLDARWVSLDVTQAGSIDAAAQTIEQEFGRLDVLVNNAGIALSAAPPSEETLETLRRTFETNLFGTFAVTRAMLPLLKKSEAGRIVNMTSDLASLTLAGDPKSQFYAINAFAYSASKTANNALTVSFAKELAGTKVKINAVTPGYVATDLNHFQGPRTVEEGAREPVRLALLGDDGPSGGFTDENGTLPW